jgi:beta-phosphoglucomutase-like phosphatase (HAD superfamily)
VKAERAVVVEDSPRGVRAAVAAGMRAFGYARSVPAGVLEAAGARTFDDLRDLPGLLGLT